LDKELKRQIKTDEFKSALEHGLEWARGHSGEVRITALVAVILAGVLGAVGYLRGTQRQEAERTFAEAVEILRAEVAGASPSAEPAGRSFASSQEKWSAATAAFDGLFRKFPSRPEGRRARYFAALSRIELGQYPDAEKALLEIAEDRRGGELEPALARLALAELHRRAGQTDKAVEAFRQIVNDPASAVPRDAALMSLASTLEDARRLAEARVSYQRLYEEFPRSVYAPEARRRADRLATAISG
jgi:tetratricopeptide (TPR) repeat protein